MMTRPFVEDLWTKAACMIYMLKDVQHINLPLYWLSEPAAILPDYGVSMIEESE